MAAEGLFLLTHSLSIDTSHSTRRGIDPALLPRLRIVETKESHTWELQSPFVVGTDSHEVVAASCEGERLTVVLAPVIEVGDEEGRTAALDELIEILQRHIEVRSTALRLEAQELTYQIEDMLAPTSRRDEELDLVGEEDRTDLVIILYRGEG